MLRPVHHVVLAALVTAATATVVSGLLATVLGLASRQPAMDGHDTLTLIGLVWSATWGVHPGADAGLGTLQAAATARATPLTLTLLTLAATVAVHRRSTRKLPAGVAALVGAVAAVLTGLAMLVVAAVCHEGLPTLTAGVIVPRLGPLGRVPLVSGLVERTLASVHARLGTSALSGLGHAAVVTLVALLLALLAERAPTGSPAWRRIGIVVAPALTGLARGALLLPAAGLVGGAVVGLTGRGTGAELPFPLHGPQWAALVSAALAYSANAGLWLLSLGVGGRLHASADLAGHGFDLTARVGALADRVHEPGLWVAVVLTPLVLGWASYAAARRARRDGSPWGWLPAWTGAVLVAAPLLTWGSRLTLAGSVDHLTGLVPGLPLGSLLGGLLPDAVALHVRLGAEARGALALAAYAVLSGLVAQTVAQTVARRRSATERS
jgi:hypothetical protein